ncbi:MAG: hypothetical protein AABX93_03250 [Nanoarchaeota archaeon]
MAEFEDGGEGFRSQIGQLADYRDSFYEKHKSEITARINPEYREYRELVKRIKKLSAPIRGPGFIEKLLG